ncbi:Biotin transporter BioY [Candidatus Rhabdochlamydia oedothoracis]|uniref:Biotin transporter n=1 Tax=Candidatus Rhabdochlamydia oedothoracis TaxID=2720720 RepID=A0ABX8V6N7_9BACT|nr:MULTISPECIES: biotin transporter BioY [Rhabdochlamydia]KAG6559461.1 Biotin transporter BioY [Candidatus Rhabdochlamydia sp. W815]MCL6756230.1 biotin transporter BioY [Candidatus Rhabdochlamydia oedothoracis]QYF49115.1 Biotin transporter BioY [Candidatus Rhabdochlamydia oedothoracis]
MNTISIPLETKNYAQEALIILGMSFLIALAAPISIPLPFTPVPIVLQNTLILALSVLFGAKRTMLAVIGFLLQGALGFPVFATCVGGFSRLLGSNAGYLLGYIIAAGVVGFLSRFASKNNLFWILSIGDGIIYLFGAIWLAAFIGWTQAITLGVLPFLCGDVIKRLLAIKCIHFLRK